MGGGKKSKQKKKAGGGGGAGQKQPHREKSEAATAPDPDPLEDELADKLEELDVGESGQGDEDKDTLPEATALEPAKEEEVKSKKPGISLLVINATISVMGLPRYPSCLVH